jgi:hypothetical protein
LRIAAARALDALLEAGRYSRHGMATAGARMNRRAIAAGAEGARRGGAAWSALKGTPPGPTPRRVTGMLVVAVTVGSAAALALRQGASAWRAAHPDADLTGSLRRVLRREQPTTPEPPPPVGSADTDVIDATASAPGSIHVIH